MAVRHQPGVLGRDLAVEADEIPDQPIGGVTDDDLVVARRERSTVDLGHVAVSYNGEWIYGSITFCCAYLIFAWWRNNLRG